MLLDRKDQIYRNGLLAEESRQRVRDVPVRYKTSWTVRRVVELEPHQVAEHDRHFVLTDDAGARITYAHTEVLSTGLTKREAMGLLAGQVSTPSEPSP